MLSNEMRGADVSLRHRLRGRCGGDRGRRSDVPQHLRLHLKPSRETRARSRESSGARGVGVSRIDDDDGVWGGAERLAREANAASAGEATGVRGTESREDNGRALWVRWSCVAVSERGVSSPPLEGSGVREAVSFSRGRTFDTAVTRRISRRPSSHCVVRFEKSSFVGNGPRGQRWTRLPSAAHPTTRRATSYARRSSRAPWLTTSTALPSPSRRARRPRRDPFPEFRPKGT